MAGTDRIIWSSEALQALQSALKGACDTLLEDIDLLSHCQNEAALAFRDRSGTLIGDVQAQLRKAIRDLDEITDRTERLIAALRRTEDMFAETEQMNAQSFEEIQFPSGETDGAANAASRYRPDRVTIANTMSVRITVTPGWLFEAADTYFSSAQ